MSRAIRLAVYSVVLSLVSLPLASCGDGTGPVPMGEAMLILTGSDAASASITSGTAGLNAAIAADGDVPSEAISAIELVLTSVELHRTGGGTEEGGEEGDEEGGGEEEGESGAGWKSLTLTEGGTIDLFNLPASSGLEVASGELPAGRYNNLRLFYSSATLRLGAPVTVRGTDIPAGDYDLLIPSGEQTGLKVPLSAVQIDSGELETLIVELLSDASLSSIRWNENGFRINPVLKQRAS